MDLPAAGEEPLKGSQPPDLLTSADLQLRLDNWRITGQPPILELQTQDPVYWTRFSTIDLRLVHHIVTLSTDMQNRKHTGFIAWGNSMSKYDHVCFHAD
jgi:hypothetical protein